LLVEFIRLNIDIYNEMSASELIMLFSLCSHWRASQYRE